MRIQDRYNLLFIHPPLLIAIGATVLLMRDLSGSGQVKGFHPIGKVVRIEKRVRYKRKGEFVWKDVQPQQPVFQGDRILAGSDSTAIIELEGGKKIQVQPDSSLLLENNLQLASNLVNRDSNGTEAGEKKNYQVHLLLPEEFSDVVVRDDDPDAKVSFAWKAIHQTKVKYLEVAANRFFEKGDSREIQIEGDASKATVRLNAGKYYWRILDDQHRPICISREFQIYAVSPVTIESPAGKIFSWDDTVEFRWTNPPQANLLSESHWIEIGSDRGFSKLIQKQPIPIRSIHFFIHSIPEGRYFWRISSRYGEVVINSEPREFFVEKGRSLSLTLIEPKDKATFSANSNASFRWDSNSQNGQFLLDVVSVTKDSEPEPIETRQLAYSLNNISEGRYRWRVRTQRGSLKAESDWREFSILKPGHLHLVSPRSGEKIELTSNGTPIQFSYESDVPQKVGKYVFEISGDPQFRTVLGQKETKTPVASSSDFNLRPGTDYFWRVVALDSTGLGFQLSEISSFRFTVFQGLHAPQGLFPQSGVTCNPLKNKGSCRFSWAPVAGASHYEIEFSAAGVESRAPAAESFKKPSLRKFTVETAFQTSSLNEGTYYWRVRAVDKNNRRGEFSSPQLVQISFGSRITAPRAHSPEVQ